MKNILLIAILWAYQAAWAQTIYHVSTTGNDGNPGTASSPLRNIQTALNLAVANDMIKVAEGTYNEGLITQSKVNLSGGYASDFLDANRDIFSKRTILSAVSAKMLRDTHGSTIDGFVFDGNNTAEVGLDITSSSVVRHNIVMRVKTSPGQGINISGNASVINNTFHNNTTGAIIFGGTSATAVFKNNIITSNSFGLNNSSADGIHRYNCVFGNSFNYTGNFNSPGIGDISLDPKHVDVAANDFRIAESSPCVNAGDPADPVGDEPTPNGSRIDMGAYGGTVHSPFRVAEPVSQPTTLMFTNVTSSSFTINYLTASGSPSGYIAVRRNGASPTSDPVDGTTYSAGSTLGDGTVVFVGSGLTFNQNSLSANTQYFFKIYSFNGSGNSINYLQTDPLQDNVFTLASEPTAQPTSLVFNNITTTSLSASFTAASGSPGGYLAVRRQGGSPSGVPVDGTAYTNGNTLGDGTVVYSGNTTSFDDTALLAGTPYHYDIFSFNGSGSSINYRTTSPLEGSQTTMAPEPTNQPTNISFSSVTSSSFTISFTPASSGPAGYIVLRKAGSAPTEIPVDGTSYSVGNSIGSSTVVNIGSASSFSDGGLNASTVYHYAIFSYNGTGVLANYLTSNPLTGSQVTSSPPAGWSLLSSPTAQWLERVFFIDANTGFAVGDQGTIIKTTNAGSSWTTQVSTSIKSLEDVFFTDANTGFAVGQDGTVLKTTNSGTNWSALTSGTSVWLWGVHFTDANVGYITGSSGVIRKTTDGGTNWTAQSSGTTNPLYDVYFTDANTGYAVGDNGTIRKTVNGGSTWSSLNSGTTTHLLAIHFIDANNGYTVGYSGTVLKTTNAGSTWSLTSWTLNHLNDVFLVDSNTAYAVGGSGTILKTDNAGSTWTTQTSGTTSNLDGLHFTDTNTGYAVGFNGVILKYQQSSGPVTEPTAQPTNISFNSVTSSSMGVSFTAASGSPAGYVALRKSGSTPTEVPTDGTTYSAGSSIGTCTVAYSGSATSFNNSGLSASTNYHFAIFSYNGSGSSVNYLNTNPLTGSQSTSAPAADITLPSISSHTPATSIAAGSALTVTAQFTDSESGIAKARIHFGPLSGLNFDGAISADMTNTSGNTYSYTIAANQITDLGIYYFFYLEDGAGNYFWSSPTLVTIQHTGDGLIIPFDGFGKNQNKYRIISVPLSLTTNTVNSVFGDDFGDYGDKSQWRMFRYQSGATQELNGSSSIVPGNGYWLIVDDGRTGTTIDSGPGTTINANYDNPYSINLSAGWNQIGNPYPYNISWQDILDNNTTTAVSKLRVYKGTWQDGTILEKFSGGFVNSNANISLAIPSYKNPAAQSGRVASSKRNPIDHEEWEVMFNLTAGNVHYNLGGIGMHPKASEGYDVYDDFTLPRFGYYLELNHRKKANNIFYARDIVPSTENYEWRFDVATNEDASVEMKWDNDFFGDNDRKLVLWDEALQKPVDMRRFNSYKIPAPAASFKVWYGNETFIRQKTEVDKLVLQNLYPNPAEDELRLSLSLPGSTPQPVNVTLYDALGNRVAVLLHEEMDSGYHEIMWTASELSAGLYIIRIQCGARQISRKVLIK